MKMRSVFGGVASFLVIVPALLVFSALYCAAGCFEWISRRFGDA